MRRRARPIERPPLNDIRNFPTAPASFIASAPTMRETWTFHSAGQLLFGPGAAPQLGEQAARLKLKRLLIVTDRSLIGAGLLKPVQEPLAAAGIAVEVFDGGEPEPSLEVVDRCLEKARPFKPDGLLGLGGG